MLGWTHELPFELSATHVTEPKISIVTLYVQPSAVETTFVTNVIGFTNPFISKTLESPIGTSFVFIFSALLSLLFVLFIVISGELGILYELLIIGVG